MLAVRVRSAVLSLTMGLSTIAATPAADPRALLAEARAAEGAGQTRRAIDTLERVLDEFDGTAVSVDAALLLVGLRERQMQDLDGDDHFAARDAQISRAERLVHSALIRRPEAEALRAWMFYFWRHTYPGMFALVSGPQTARPAPRGREYSCAAPFVALLAACAPGEAIAPKLMLRAGNCEQWANVYPEATRQYERLLAEHARSEEAMAALEGLFAIRMAVADFAAAARLAEQYAGRHPDSRETPKMLATAATLRLGLGQDAQARALFARHDAADRWDSRFHAEFLRERLALPGTREQQIGWMQAYVRRHHEHRWPDELVFVTTTLARALWQRSCEQGEQGGLCMSRGGEVQETGGRCEPSLGPAIPRFYRRDERQAADAQRSFAAAAKAARKVGDDRYFEPGRRLEFEHMAAMAGIHRVDPLFEAMMRESVPRPASRLVDANGRVHARARARLTRYFRRTDATARGLARAYATAAARWRSPAAKVAALARAGQLAEFRAHAVHAAGPPDGGIDDAEGAAYCAVAREYAEPLLAQAKDAYRRCLELAISSGALDEFSQACATGLMHLDPRGYPRLAELFGADAGLPDRLVGFGVQERIEEEPGARRP